MKGSRRPKEGGRGVCDEGERGGVEEGGNQKFGSSGRTPRYQQRADMHPLEGSRIRGEEEEWKMMGVCGGKECVLRGQGNKRVMCVLLRRFGWIGGGMIGYKRARQAWGEREQDEELNPTFGRLTDPTSLLHFNDKPKEQSRRSLTAET